MLKYRGKDYNIQPPELEVHQIRPAFRVGREGRQIQQVIINLIQTVRLQVNETKTKDKIKRKKSADESEELIFRGGCTIILSLSDLNKVEFTIAKNVLSQRRFDQQMEFQNSGQDLSMNLSTYNFGGKNNQTDLSFKNLHFHSH
jgi:carbonic anhydrase